MRKLKKKLMRQIERKDNGKNKDNTSSSNMKLFVVR